MSAPSSHSPGSGLPARRPTQGVAPELSSRCAGCAAPLAPDQLFCLSCGTRRRDARIAFRDVLASEAAPVLADGGGQGGSGLTPAAPMGQAANGGGSHPSGSYLPFIAMLASLLLALGVGVWIGRGQEAPVATAAPVAVPVAATTAAPVETTPADDAADDSAAKDSEDAAAAEDEAAPPAQDDSAKLKDLEKLSPEEYQKQSQKLPKEVGTGGTPPPKDGKTGGGGTEFESFE